MTYSPLDPLRFPLSGTQLIEASAGTGKTYTITTIVLRLLLEKELAVDRMAVVTFTNAATSELRDRVRRRIAFALEAFEAVAREKSSEPLADEVIEHLIATQDVAGALRALRQAQRDLDRASIFTIHGFAQRMLQEHAFESGARFDLELVGDQRPLVTELAYDFWAREIAPLDEDCWAALSSTRLTFQGFVNLAYVAVAWPDLPLEPDVSETSPRELEESLELLRASWSSVCQEYRLAGDQAFQCLTAKGLHGRYYSADRLASYRSQLEELVTSRPCLPQKAPSFLKYLAAGSIQTNKNVKEPEHTLFDAVARLSAAMEECRRRAARVSDALRCRLVKFARERAAQEHKRAGTQSFDDLLHTLLRALRDGARGPALARRIRGRLPVALIDEFQDTDPVQYEIFSRVYASKAGGSALFLIGDPKQAIYAFRGADVYAYLKAVHHAADGVWTLSTNYRSDPGLVTALNCVFGRLEHPFLEADIGYTKVQAAPGRTDELHMSGAPVAPLEVVYLSRAAAGRQGTARWEGIEEWERLTALEIARLLGSPFALETSSGKMPIEPCHVAVLTRSNRQAQNIQEHLRALGIPSVLGGDRSVFEAPEAEELALILRALAEPFSARAVRTALATRFLGLDAHAISALSRDENAWERWMLCFREYNAIWADRGLMQCLERLLKDHGVVPRTLAELDGERRMTNLRHLSELLHQAACEHHLGIPGLVRWYDDARFDPTRQGMAPEAQQLRLESDADAVVLTTMHRSKGLEYPIVVLPFLGARSAPFDSELENLKAHNPHQSHRLELDVRAREHKAEKLGFANHEHQAEALRLAYVALTRARHHCLVLWGGVSAAFSSLGYLLHQPAIERAPLEADIMTRLGELDDEARFAEVEALALESQGTVRVRRAELGGAPMYRPRRAATPVRLSARALERSVPAPARTSSFSAMTRAHDLTQLGVPSRDGRDVDDNVFQGPASNSLLHVSDDAVTLATFPRGARPGEFLHAVLEKVPFGPAEQAERQKIIQIELGRHGFDPNLEPLVSQAVEEILTTPLDRDRPWTLASLSPEARVCEMEFTLPVTRPQAEGSAAEALSRLLAQQSNAPWSRDYPRRLARLGFRGWSGFLRGFVDLIFEREGAFYLVDYKSNHLGPSREHYSKDMLGEVMGEHHYHLQYLLYAVALHRHLQQRLPSYRSEEHLGGVYYLFLRGMHPSTGAERGVFFHKPGSELISRVSRWLDGDDACI